MTKIFKKSLAVVVAAALCLTAFVGCLTVSAAESTGTVTIGTASVAEGTATASVTVNLTSTGFLAMYTNITYPDTLKLTGVTSSNAGLISNFEIAQNQEGATYTEGNLKLIVENNDNLNNLTEASYTLTFNTSATPVGEYVLTYVSSDAADASENTVAFTGTNGKLSVTASHTHVWSTEWSHDATNHWHVCTAAGCTDPVATSDLAAHTWDDGVVTTQPTNAADGVKTYTCTVCGATKTEVIPKITAALDTNISVVPSINIGATINVRYTITAASLPADCADFYVTVSRNKAVSSASGYNYSAISNDFQKNAMTYVSSLGTYNLLYTGVALYEQTIPVNAVLHCLDARGNEIAYSNIVTTTVAKVAQELYTSTTLAKTKNLLSDLMNMGAFAQTYFVNGKTCDLANAAMPNMKADSPNEAFELVTTPTVSQSALNTANTAESLNGSSVTIAPGCNVSTNPCLRFIVSNASTYNTETIKLVISYTNGKGVAVNKTINYADFTKLGSGASLMYAYLIGDMALYDSNKTVTATFYDGTTALASATYSVESYINTNYSGSRSSDMLQAIAKFGVSARTYFNAN